MRTHRIYLQIPVCPLIGQRSLAGAIGGRGRDSHRPNRCTSRWRTRRCRLAAQLANCREHLASMAEQDAHILEVLVSQMRQHRGIHAVLGEALAVLGQQPVGSNRFIDKLLVTRPTWHQGGSLLYGEATIVNRNPYSVWQVIIACDL